MPEASKTHSSLILHNESTYEGLQVLTHKGPLLGKYLDIIKLVFDDALLEYNKVLVLRFDLRFPLEIEHEKRSSVISDFFESLRARIKYEESKARQAGTRCHETKVRYVWVREHAEGKGWHYHVALFLNGNRFNGLGSLDSDFNNLAIRITSSWASAIKAVGDPRKMGVFFPRDAFYRVSSAHGYSQVSAMQAFRRLSYFAKLDTKHFNNCSRNIGYSQITHLHK